MLGHQLVSIGFMEENLELSETSQPSTVESTTFYQVATDAMEEYIEIYLALSSLMVFQIFRILI